MVERRAISGLRQLLEILVPNAMSDGVETQIRWVSRYSDIPNLDGVPAREYERDSKTLRILERPISGRAVSACKR
jgi:hypothetical protein